MSIEDKINDEVMKLAPEVYKDIFKPAAQELGTVAKRSAKALLSPLRVCLWSLEKFEAFIVDGVNKRFENIPEEQRKPPDPEIAVPLIQSLSYTTQNKTLREMYLNLLANSMNTAMDKSVHPSFVEIIKQLSSPEAELLLYLSNSESYPEVCTHNSHESVEVGVYSIGSDIKSHKVKEEFFNVCTKFKTKLDINSALDNFRRLQILDIETNTKQTFESESPISLTVNKNININITHIEKLYFTSFGIKFVEICVNDKT